MASSFGWIIAAFLGGAITAWAVISRRSALMQNFSRVEHFTGRSLREVVTIAGRRPGSVVRANDRKLVTWRSAGYSITLEFDDKDICRGVIDEKY